MKRDVVAPVRKAKSPLPVVPVNRDLRQDLSTRLKVEDKSSRSGEFNSKIIIIHQDMNMDTLGK